MPPSDCVQRIDGGHMMAHEKMIKMEPAIYPYLKSDIKTTSIASGQYSFSVDDVFQGLVPCKLIVGLASSAAYMGDYRKNLFYFRKLRLLSLGFYVDGQSYPSQPLRPNYEANQYIDSYRTLTIFRKDVYIDRYDYTEGYCLYVLEVDPYYSFNTERKGTLPTGNEICQTLAGERYLDPVRHLPLKSSISTPRDPYSYDKWETNDL